ncbi:hypothetical protein CANCADRAFT_101642 [Tortispora caseinolytica NRRL Y-17796]|uniref:ATP-dependent Clp protease proteolytic subunit n=1 Tax=Tortispora caseinolytica NRRL Y-17796 TaxID=767744 RepID=A0A1E4TEL5_9ASCO|nr:hypothetical protein CANCADRAFT_101642 [Tortispora caseinolytica NRRL Y-17796]
MAALRGLRSLIPTVIDENGSAMLHFDVFSMLLRERIIMITGPIEDNMASTTVAQLLFLERESKDKPINVYINSPGGSVTAGLSIYDTMQFIKSPVSTVCVGQAASMASLLLAGGAKGQRSMLENASVMIHQPSGGIQGQASDIAIQAKQILQTRELLNRLYKRHMKSDLTLESINQLMERDNYLQAEQALELGLIDNILVGEESKSS